ncbi:hypothetical protein [Streptomyces noursei]|uniref:hypothetical protein n=1 Tax=Streptomyces noursei TaxID=1971 RepID=UPI00196405C9|nr:hypothetical protein [Streptomyces noursei]QRX90831.1 hypothetical protein JNO44_08325 [Streptomyces noursei]
MRSAGELGVLDGRGLAGGDGRARGAQLGEVGVDVVRVDRRRRVGVAVHQLGAVRCEGGE